MGTALLPDSATLGWLAATLTLLTFHCTDMLRLRVLALGANGAFVAYGLAAGLVPVLALHLVLIPMNLWRLRQAWRLRQVDRPGTAVAQASGPRAPRVAAPARTDAPTAAHGA